MSISLPIPPNLKSHFFVDIYILYSDIRCTPRNLVLLQGHNVIPEFVDIILKY